MASEGYYKICPRCFRKYGRHFAWCLDCTPRAKPGKDGRYSANTYRTIWGTVASGTKVELHFCCSKKLPLDKRLLVCEKCRAKFKCFTQEDDDIPYEIVSNTE